VISTGVSYRQLELPGVSALVGAGIFYGASTSEAVLYRDLEVGVMGGGNSAGQAAVYLARFAKRVTLILRGESLAAGMSQYLVDQLEALPNVHVRTGSSLAAVDGGARLAGIRLKTAHGEEEVPVSALFVTIVLTLVTARLVEGRIGPYDPADAGEVEEETEVQTDPADEARGLRYALWATLAVVAVIALLTAIPGAPLRNPETGRVIGDSPFMDSLILIISLIFFAAGLGYGRGVGTIKTSADVLSSITKSWAGLASLLFLFLLIAQFIAYFNFSNMAQVAAVKLGDLLERADIGAVWLLLGFIVVTMVVDLIMPAAIAKWAILAPIFIPLLIRLNVTPQTVLAAYRVGDSPLNVVTPLMAYFPLIVVFVKRYQRSAGIGTVVSLMLPYVFILSVAWTLFFVAWYLIGIPLGPGSPVHP